MQQQRKIRVGRSLRYNNNPASSTLEDLFQQIVRGIVRKISVTIARDQMMEMQAEIAKMKQNREGV